MIISFRHVPALILLLAISHPAEAQPLSWQEPIDVARGNGERGPWQQNNSRYDYIDDPSVAIDERGNTAIAWVDQKRKDVFFQRFSADGKPQSGEPVNISRNPDTLSWLPRVVTAPDAPQQMFILWQEIIFSGGSHGGDMFFVRSGDGGATFSDPVNLTNASLGGEGKGRINPEVWHNGSFDLVAGPGGNLVAAWTEYDGPLWISRSTDGGKTFSQPQRIAGGGSAKPARGPALAFGPGRTVYLAWTVGEENGADIRIATSGDGGTTFGEPVIVAPSGNYSDAPKIAVGRNGTVHLAYAESSGGPFDRFRIRYTQSTDGARTFAPARDISMPAPTANASASFPALGIDAKDNLVVTWELAQDRRTRPRGLGFAVSRDAGKSFTPPGVVPHASDPAGGFNGSHQGLLMEKLAVSSNGLVAVANSSLKQDDHSRIWLMRGSLSQ